MVKSVLFIKINKSFAKYLGTWLFKKTMAILEIKKFILSEKINDFSKIDKSNLSKNYIKKYKEKNKINYNIDFIMDFLNPFLKKYLNEIEFFLKNWYELIGVDLKNINNNFYSFIKIQKISGINNLQNFVPILFFEKNNEKIDLILF